MTRRLIPAAAIAAVLAGCSDSTDPRVPSELELSQTAITLDFGQTTTITATVRDQHGAALEDQTVTWSSSNENVATVNDGEITAVGAGQAQITATSGSLQEPAQVTVVNAPTSVAVNPGSLLLAVGQTGAITAVVRNESGEAMIPPPAGYEITWTSGSDAVATVDDGTVTAVASGQTAISANAGDLPPGQVQTNVVQPHAVEVSHDFVELDVGTRYDVTASVVNPDGQPISTLPAGYEIVWSSSDTDIATVGSSIRGLALGDATIFATSADLPPAEIEVTVGREYAGAYEYSGDVSGSVSVAGLYPGATFIGEGFEWVATFYQAGLEDQDVVFLRDRGDGLVDILWFFVDDSVSAPGSPPFQGAFFYHAFDFQTQAFPDEFDYFAPVGSGSVTFTEVTPFRMQGTFSMVLEHWNTGEEVTVSNGTFNAVRDDVLEVDASTPDVAASMPGGVDLRALMRSFRDRR